MMTITEIYNQYHKQVFNAVRQMVKNSHDAEDVTSMVFVKVDKYLAEFDDSKASFNTWLYKITQSVMYDFFRTNHQDRFTAVSDFMTADGNEIFTFNTSERADDRVKTGETQAEIAKAFRSLKPRYRKIATLYFLRQYSYEEISTMLELPLGSVKGMLNRCRTRLQNELQGLYHMA